MCQVENAIVVVVSKHATIINNMAGLDCARNPGQIKDVGICFVVLSGGGVVKYHGI